MDRITQTTTLDRVEYIIGSGTGILDFAVEGESGYYTWEGNEDANWKIEDVSYVENSDEDRLLIYPEGDFFTCEIYAEAEEGNSGPVWCWSE